MNVAVLIATKNRSHLLSHRSLPSVLNQTHAVNLVVIINDGVFVEFEQETLYQIRDAANVPIVLLNNCRTPGAGGAWNTGLEYLRDNGGCDFVAILDDDDQWESSHIEENLKHSGHANIVVSGLRMMRGGVELPRPLIESLSPVDFLSGNPGWQGSNTFVRLDLLLSVGGFREGLVSLNDRDLAVRLLSHTGSKVAFTNSWTAIWYSDTRGNLSEPHSIAKLRGLQMFWQLYKHQMNADVQVDFFTRAQRLFGISSNEIIEGTSCTIPSLGFEQ